jgi:hypothetical protein
MKIPTTWLRYVAVLLIAPSLRAQQLALPSVEPEKQIAATPTVPDSPLTPFIVRSLRSVDTPIKPQSDFARYWHVPVQEFRQNPSQGSQTYPDDRCRKFLWAGLVLGAAVIGGGVYLIATSKRTTQPGPPPVQKRSIPRLAGGITMIFFSPLVTLLPLMDAGCD